MICPVLGRAVGPEASKTRVQFNQRFFMSPPFGDELAGMVDCLPWAASEQYVASPRRRSASVATSLSSAACDCRTLIRFESLGVEAWHGHALSLSATSARAASSRVFLFVLIGACGGDVSRAGTDGDAATDMSMSDVSADVPSEVSAAVSQVPTQARAAMLSVV